MCKTKTHLTLLISVFLAGRFEFASTTQNKHSILAILIYVCRCDDRYDLFHKPLWFWGQFSNSYAKYCNYLQFFEWTLLVFYLKMLCFFFIISC